MRTMGARAFAVAALPLCLLWRRRAGACRHLCSAGVCTVGLLDPLSGLLMNARYAGAPPAFSQASDTKMSSKARLQRSAI